MTKKAKSVRRRAILRQRKQDHKDQRTAILVAIRMKHGYVPTWLTGLPMHRLSNFLDSQPRENKPIEYHEVHRDIVSYWNDRRDLEFRTVVDMAVLNGRS